LFSATFCAAAEGAKRGQIKEDYVLSGFAGVIESISDRTVEVTTGTGVTNDSCKLSKDSVGLLRVGDKISVYGSEGTSEYALLIFN
jgi:hydrogenase maturation factor